MVKQIRPLTAFKKVNPDLYDIILSNKERTGSKKHQENSFYFNYCFYASGIVSFIDSENEEEVTSSQAWQFFYKNEHDKNHIATVTELGRLLLTGWYYNMEDYIKTVINHIYGGYVKINGQGKKLNDQKFAEAVKHIRENIGFYYQNENELKSYLLEKFFNEVIKVLLPEPPEEVRQHKEIIEIIMNEKQRNEKQDKDYYYNMADLQEGYIDYLTDLLDSHSIDYFDIEQYKDNQRQEWEPRKQEIIQAYKYYEEQKEKVLNNNLKLLT